VKTWKEEEKAHRNGGGVGLPERLDATVFEELVYVNGDTGECGVLC
jgi:hypothetical protein